MVVINPNNVDCIQQIKKLTGGLGAYKSIECSGGKLYQSTCINGTRRKGQIAFVGESKSLTVKVSDDLIRKGLTIYGSWHWNLKDTKKILDRIANKNTLISKLITHKFTLSEAEDAFKLQISGRCGKVLLHPWE